ncbi:uncharacterized protein LOC109821878 [Asparagus officinalis]|uniref:uncharacterized protein LOC109821878 n=1 Tax=Asparagus officinalis TaxID=4686 RepID=UPI00098E7A1F|nr:uncharacterized protein LOC109821878 [Asparagus officinalis]
MKSFGTMIKLDGSNWQVWKSKMKDILYSKDLHDHIEGDNAKSKKMTDKEWEKLYRKVIGYIRMWIDVSMFHHVSGETNAKSLWKKFEDLYEKKTAENKTFIMKRLVNLKFKE